MGRDPSPAERAAVAQERQATAVERLLELVREDRQAQRDAELLAGVHAPVERIPTFAGVRALIPSLVFGGAQRVPGAYVTHDDDSAAWIQCPCGWVHAVPRFDCEEVDCGRVFVELGGRVYVGRSEEDSAQDEGSSAAVVSQEDISAPQPAGDRGSDQPGDEAGASPPGGAGP